MPLHFSEACYGTSSVFDSLFSSSSSSSTHFSAPMNRRISGPDNSWFSINGCSSSNPSSRRLAVASSPSPSPSLGRRRSSLQNKDFPGTLQNKDFSSPLIAGDGRTLPDMHMHAHKNSRSPTVPDGDAASKPPMKQQQRSKSAATLAPGSGSLASASIPALEASLEEALLLESSTSSSSARRLLYRFLYIRRKQWKKVVLSIKSHVQNTSSKRVTYSLVSKSYTRVQITSEKSITPISYLQGCVCVATDQLASLAGEKLVWMQQMGNRYGVSLLCLLVVGYWIQGFRCFPLLAMSYHLQDGLQVDPSTMQFLQSTANLPMVAKPLYGIISDTIYIGGARRMPYLMMAGILQVSSWSTIVLHSGIRSSALPLLGILILSNVGAAMAEVVNDALVAESVRKERGRSKGELQSFVWLALAIGGIMGNLAGGLAMSRLSCTVMFGVFSILMAGQLVVTLLVKEESFNLKPARQFLSRKLPEKQRGALETLKQQAMKLKELVSKPEIARPLIWFSASYALVPALAGSLFFYQTKHLQIHPTFLGLAKVVGQIGLLGAGLLYNQCLKKSSPRQVIMAVQILLSVCILSDVFLVSRLNIKLGIPDHLYVLGASAFVEALAQFKILPFSVLLTQLCPAGSEGSLLAVFMSCHCLASILSGYLGTILANSLHLSADSFAGLPLGIVIQSLAALVPLLWISCIPNKQVKRDVHLYI